MDQFIKNGIDFLTTYGGKIVIALLVLIIGCFVIKLLNKLIAKGIDKTKVDETVKVVSKKVIRILLYVLLFIGVIEILGVPMSSVVAVLASCGLALGLALQGALANLAGGLMILIFKPFKIGDYIEVTGAEGHVRDISIFYTTLITLDNRKILVPNGDLMSANVTNFTAEDIRRSPLRCRGSRTRCALGSGTLRTPYRCRRRYLHLQRARMVRHQKVLGCPLRPDRMLQQGSQRERHRRSGRKDRCTPRKRRRRRMILVEFPPSCGIIKA